MTSVRRPAGGSSSPSRGDGRRTGPTRPSASRGTPPARTSHPLTTGGSKATKPEGASANQSSKTPRTRSSRPRVKRRYTRRAALLAAVVAVLMLSFAYPIRQYVAQRTQIAQNRDDQAAQKQHIAQLQERIDRWNDDGYIREQARKRLQYVEPGELTYLVEGADPGDSHADPGVWTDGKERTEKTGKAWYGQLWTGVQSGKKSSSE